MQDRSANFKKLSKFLSYVLRHHPGVIGISLDQQGWAPVDDLLRQLTSNGYQIDLPLLRELVETNEKKRFAFSADGTRIRASQGHSLKVELNVHPQQPPEVLYHGTAEKNLEQIMQAGIQKMQRQHVHLNADPVTAKNVGQRHGRPMVLRVAAGKMFEDGLTFFVSDNGVWLTEAVPPAYISLQPVRP